METDNAAEVEVVVHGGAFVLLLLVLQRRRIHRRFRVHPYLIDRNENRRFNTAVNVLKYI